MKPKSAAALAVSFFLLVPFTTFVLLWLKGLPEFTQGHYLAVVIWVYGVCLLPALLSGILLAVVVSGVTRRAGGYFSKPYDFGRSFSLGAILGALTEAFATWIFRLITHHPFSDFWIAGATIAGCLTGAALTAIVLSRQN